MTVCVLQMWAYLATYQLPHDDPEALEHRVHVDYPVRIDRALGLGVPLGLRIQRRLAHPGAIRRRDEVLIWAHWLWFLVPHGSLLYILRRAPERFASSAVQTYAVFDLGVVVYWALPTAPPWYAAARGRLDDDLAPVVDGDPPRRGAGNHRVAQADSPALRRLMYEHGDEFWRGAWKPLYSFLGGNPLAAMPSLHFATTLMAAHLLGEVGVVEGAAGWAYAATLGVALVYLGEHYVVDLIAGAALAEGVRRNAWRATPALRAFGERVTNLERAARA